MDRPKRFILFFAIGFFGLAGVVIAIHILGNPDWLFPSPKMPSRDFLSWKTRRLEAHIYSHQAPQAIILGSSRSMEMPPAVVKDITGYSTFNYAFVGASAVQELAQLKFLLARGDHPKLLVLGIDERGMFGHFTNIEGRMVESWPVLRQAPLWKQISLFAEALTQIKPESTPQAMQNIFVGQQLRKLTPIQTAGIMFDDGYRIRVAETVHQARKPLNPEQRREYLKNKIDNEDAKDTPKLASFREGSVQKDQRDYVSQIVKIARNNHMRTIVIVTPMQPYFDQMVMPGAARENMDAYVKSLREECAKIGVEVCDFRQVESFDGLDYEFWDAQHATSVNTTRMLNKALGIDPLAAHPNVVSDYELVIHPTKINTIDTW